jgi:hypothetical protein
MLKILKLMAASGAALLAAGCVAYPYDDPYYGGGGYAYGGGGYAYGAPAYAAPSVNFRYYDNTPSYRSYRSDTYVYRDGRDGGGRYWKSERERRGHDDRYRGERNHRDHRYYDGR